MYLISSIPERARPWIIAGVCLLILSVSVLVYAQASSTIRRNVYIGNTKVGGMTAAEAYATLASNGNASLNNTVLYLVIDDMPYPIPGQDIDLRSGVDEAVSAAWNIGRSKNPFKNLVHLIRLPVSSISIPLQKTYDAEKLTLEIDTIGELVNQPGKDVRLFIDGTDVTILTDTKTGYLLNTQNAMNAIDVAIRTNTDTTTSLTLTAIEPSVSVERAREAQEQAERILADRLELTHDIETFTLFPERVALWIQSIPEGQSLRIALDEAAISAHVATIAQDLDGDAQAPEVTVDENGKVTEFTAPRTGRQLDQSKAVADIIAALMARAERREAADETEQIALVVSERRPEITDVDAQKLGITELIGKASTRFTGSPANRIWNIKNGVTFLTGKLVAPGEEFSTITALGNIDNTTGYLPELVIKENRTVPEYGGGLCQVSTTLFRATMNTGLPITARRNHSYRVSYYEKDGDGNYIGPGLDATIYSPNPDFKFINDTKHHILLQGYVEGDKITFEFYGTKDGRTSEIDGPHTLSTTPAGEPIYADTDTLPPGEIKQIEKPHAGGTAVATYTVTYPDGTVKTEKYESFYRNWPARFIVGADPSAAPAEGEAPSDSTTPTDSIIPSSENPSIES